ncbi:hypothetical protein GC177_06045 [bacterium]|nr:hypothetical protein [bacterium]
MPASATVIWALTDSRPGNNSQSTGLAAALTDASDRIEAWREVPLDYRWPVRLPSCLLPATMPVARLPNGTPDIIIAAGRRAGLAARHFKQRLGGRVKLIQLMDPGAHRQDFDLLILPTHDTHAAGLAAKHANILLCRGALHRLTPQRIEQEARTRKPDVKAYKAPFIAVVIGGSTRYGEFTEADAARLARRLNALAEDRHATLLITTSRRTGQAATDSLLAGLTVPHHYWLWHADMTRETNPYPGMLGLADEIVVTGESMSMLSEACLTGKPVWIADIGPAIAPKHHRLHLELMEHDHAMMLETPPPLAFNAAPLDEMGRITGLIQQRMGL